MAPVSTWFRSIAAKQSPVISEDLKQAKSLPRQKPHFSLGIGSINSSLDVSMVQEKTFEFLSKGLIGTFDLKRNLNLSR